MSGTKTSGLPLCCSAQWSSSDLSAQSGTESHSYLLSVHESVPVLHRKEGCSNKSSNSQDPEKQQTEQNKDILKVLLNG